LGGVIASLISGPFVLVGLKFAGADEGMVWLALVPTIIVCPFAIPRLVRTIKRMEHTDAEHAEVAAAAWERRKVESAEQFRD
jgi:uncharacterized membrane protein YoaK (UPF0700 family)